MTKKYLIFLWFLIRLDSIKRDCGAYAEVCSLLIAILVDGNCLTIAFAGLRRVCCEITCDISPII